MKAICLQSLLSETDCFRVFFLFTQALFSSDENLLPLGSIATHTTHGHPIRVGHLRNLH